LDKEARSGELTTYLSDKALNCWFSGMTRVPQTVSDLVKAQLETLPHVRAVLMGCSGEVHHVWVLIDDWTQTGRKAVYSAQKDLVAKLRGFDLDFYVVAADSGEEPAELVSDIPVIFKRTA